MPNNSSGEQDAYAKCAEDIVENAIAVYKEDRREQVLEILREHFSPVAAEREVEQPNTSILTMPPGTLEGRFNFGLGIEGGAPEQPAQPPQHPHETCNCPHCLQHRALRVEAQPAEVRAGIFNWEKEAHDLNWNLAGCDTLAMGYEIDTAFDEKMARPALFSVQKLAKHARDLQSQLAERTRERDASRAYSDTQFVAREAADRQRAEAERRAEKAQAELALCNRDANEVINTREAAAYWVNVRENERVLADKRIASLESELAARDSRIAALEAVHAEALASLRDPCQSYRRAIEILSRASSPDAGLEVAALREKPFRLTFDVHRPEDRDAGLIAYSEIVTVELESGNPQGEAGEFAAFIRDVLCEWFDGAKVKHVTLDAIRASRASAGEVKA